MTADAAKGAALTIAAAIVVLVLLSSAAGCFERPEAGKISVIRNGGPLDDRGIREVLPPGARNSWIGVFSSEHEYPSSSVQRFYTITAEGSGDRPGVDVVRTQTADGFLVGLEGTFYFTTAFSDTDEGLELVQRFDDQFGVRTFTVPGSGERRHPWEGDDGWAAFLDQIIRPIIDNQIRTAMLRFRCDELISSCSLVARRAAAPRRGSTETGAATNANLQRVEEEVVRGVAEEVRETLGAEYLTNWRFELVRPTLPDQIQVAINSAQSAFARISEARADAERAQAQRQAASALANVYQRSPALAQIQMIREAKELDGANIYIGIDPVVPTQPNR